MLCVLFRYALLFNNCILIIIYNKLAFLIDKALCFYFIDGKK